MVESTVEPRPFEIHAITAGVARILHRTNVRLVERDVEADGESVTLWVYDEEVYRIPVRYTSASEMREAIRNCSAQRERLARILEKLGASRALAASHGEWVRDADAPAASHWAQIDSFNVAAKRPLSVTRNWKGHAISLDCYVTQDIADAFRDGKLSVGDYVIVEFMDGNTDLPVAVQKVFKSW